MVAFAMAANSVSPYVDDSRFADSLEKFHGQHVSELAKYLNDNGREYEICWCASGMIWGVIATLLDGRNVEIATKEAWLEEWEFRNDLVGLTEGHIIDSNQYLTSFYTK